MESKPAEKVSRLVRIRLDPDGGYFFVYKDGTIYKALKTDLKMEETENGFGFWQRILFTLSEAVNERTEKAESVA